MSERINELIKQSYVTTQSLSGEEHTYFSQEKFAELIIRECVKVAMRSVGDDEPKEAWYLIQEHFGVEE